MTHPTINRSNPDPAHDGLRLVGLVATLLLTMWSGGAVLAVEAQPRAAKAKCYLFLLAGGHNFVPELGSFVEAVEKILPDGDIQAARVPPAGKRASFADWRTEGVTPSAGLLYTTLVEKARARMEQRRPDGVVLVWRYGIRGMSPEVYVSRLSELIGALRADLKRPDLGVVIGFNKDGGRNELTAEAPISVLQPERLAWVDAADTLVHGYSGRVELAERYAEQAAALAAGRPRPGPRAAMPPPLPAKAGGRLRLFITAGQSNMVALNPQVNLIPLIRQALPEDELVQVHDARGGIPICHWYDQVPDGTKATTPASTPPDHAPSTAEPTPEATPAYQDLLKRIRDALGTRRPESVVFLWMQGETDGMRSKGGDPTHYAFRLLGLVESLRRDLQRPDMKVVIGRICDWGNGRNWNQVREAQVAFAERDGQAAWVDCDDLNDRLDDDGQYRNDLHYTESGYMRLGQRFAEQAVKLIKAQESKPSTCAHRAVDQDDHPAMPPPIRPPV